MATQDARHKLRWKPLLAGEVLCSGVCRPRYEPPGERGNGATRAECSLRVAGSYDGLVGRGGLLAPATTYVTGRAPGGDRSCASSLRSRRSVNVPRFMLRAVLLPQIGIRAMAADRCWWQRARHVGVECVDASPGARIYCDLNKR